MLPPSHYPLLLLLIIWNRFRNVLLWTVKLENPRLPCEPDSIIITNYLFINTLCYC